MSFGVEIGFEAQCVGAALAAVAQRRELAALWVVRRARGGLVVSERVSACPLGSIAVYWEHQPSLSTTTGEQVVKPWQRTAVAVFGVLTCLGAALLAASDAATAAASGPQVITASTQDVFATDPALSVIVDGKTVSALPFRVRVLNQSSPLAYSLDLRRSVSYGDAWTALSLGRPNHDEDRSLSRVGVRDPLLAEAAALVPFPAHVDQRPGGSDLEYSARQVAIWTQTNGLLLNRQTVPNADLRARASQVVAAMKSGAKVPLQAAYHSVNVFVRETTASVVRVAVVIDIDPNTELSTQQNIDLYLDGVRLPIRTRALTRISQDSGTYVAVKPHSFAPGSGSNAVAEVELERNTRVVDVTATWVNVQSDPGLVMVSSGTAPPAITAETAVLNFTSSTELDPASYTKPSDLFSKAATAILIHLPSWLVWVALALALYMLPRVGRALDVLFGRAWRRVQGSPAESVTYPMSVRVSARTEGEAVAAGLRALGVGSSSRVDIEVMQSASRSRWRGRRNAQVLMSMPAPGETS